MPTLTPKMPVTTAPVDGSAVRRLTDRVLRSRAGRLLDDLMGPHGLDRYLELVNPLLARDVNRALVTDVRRETHDVTTLTLRPARWHGHRAGQWVEVTVEVDGRRHRRCYSISSSPHRDDGQFTITVKADPDGLVSRHLAHRIGRGSVLEVSDAQGDFVLPGAVGDRPEHVLLVSGGSGVTPVMSMLRALADEGASTRITWLHYARTWRDVPFADELVELHGRRRRVTVTTVLTREDGDLSLDAAAPALAGHLCDDHLDAVLDGAAGVPAFVCGPAGLLDAARGLWARRGAEHLLHTEAFTVDRVQLDPEETGGTLTFADSRLDVVADARTVLEQAEAAGLSPQSGCRMGICHTCIRPKLSGRVRDVRDGRLSSCDPEDVQICISAPVGDVTIDL